MAFETSLPSRRPHRAILPAALAFLALAPGLFAATIDVPGDAATIQDAISIAQAGDEVVVAPGTWPGIIDFLGKAITVRSSGGPAVTIIDGQFSGPVVAFVNGEGASSVLEGFTVRNGLIQDIDVDSGGAGIRIVGASPVIRGNVIADNTSTWTGAGIFCWNSNAHLEGNLFTGNSFNPFIADAPFGSGAGLHVRGGAVTLVDNRFSGNYGADHGGAIFFEDTQGSTATSTICSSNASGIGGAIAVGGTSNVVLENLLLVGNEAVGLVSFIGLSQGYGGAIAVTGASVAQIRSATILGNTAYQGFDGPGTGGGVHSGSTLTVPTLLASSIVRGNSAGADPQVGPNIAVTYSDIQGGAFGTGNFDADPLFVAGPNGAHYLSQLAAGQGVQSPCVDAGDPSASPLAGTTTRTDEAPDAGTIDVGFHFPAPEVPFRRGDCNGDLATNIADAIFLLSVLFPAPPGPVPSIGCADACDGNDDGASNIADVITILGALFGGIPLPAPTGACGADPSADALGCDVPPAC